MRAPQYQTKENLRKAFLDQRLAMTDEKVHQLSHVIQKNVIKTVEFQKSSCMGLYSSIKNEVETTLLLMSALEKGVFVYYPRVEQGIRFYEVCDPSDLQKGAWGVLEPKHGCAQLDETQKLELLIIPGIVFDRQGFRVGYGRGFYDRSLQTFKGRSVALAYHFQVIDHISGEAWDQRVSCIVTEKKVYGCL